MCLNLLLHYLLCPQIAKNKVLGLLQPLEARELGESFAHLMATPGGVQLIFHDNVAFSDSYPSLPYLFRGGNRTTHSGNGTREA